MRSGNRQLRSIYSPVGKYNKVSLKLTMLKWTKSILSWLTSVSIFRTTTEQFIGRSMRLGKPGLVT